MSWELIFFAVFSAAMLICAIGVVAFGALAIWMLQLEAVGKLRAMRGWGSDDERPEAGDA